MADRAGSPRTLTYDPGADAAERLPGWVIRHADLRGVPEVLCPRRQVILIERAETKAERRCSLAHAIAHVDLGHEATHDVFAVRQEVEADQLAARRLMPLSALCDALLWTNDPLQMADELDVDLHMLRVRYRHLHPSERVRLLGLSALRDEIHAC